VSARDFLERLRPSAAPGAPASAGVPADRVAERSAELEALFARLEPVQAEAARIRTEAVTEAARRRAAAQQQAQSVVADAQLRAQAERSAAAAEARASGELAADQVLADARREAEDLAVRARGRQSDLVGQVLAAARAELLRMAGAAP
jgi:F0F1-type ATP synthase membrane subunit b/b'